MGTHDELLREMELKLQSWNISHNSDTLDEALLLADQWALLNLSRRKYLWIKLKSAVRKGYSSVLIRLRILP